MRTEWALEQQAVHPARRPRACSAAISSHHGLQAGLGPLEEHVLMLEVAVHEAVLVQGLEPSAYVQRDRASGEGPRKPCASGVGDLSVRVAACM